MSPSPSLPADDIRAWFVAPVAVGLGAPTTGARPSRQRPPPRSGPVAPGRSAWTFHSLRHIFATRTRSHATGGMVVPDCWRATPWRNPAPASRTCPSSWVIHLRVPRTSTSPPTRVLQGDGVGGGGRAVGADASFRHLVVAAGWRARPHSALTGH